MSDLLQKILVQAVTKSINGTYIAAIEQAKERGHRFIMMERYPRIVERDPRDIDCSTVINYTQNYTTSNEAVLLGENYVTIDLEANTLLEGRPLTPHPTHTLE